MTGMVRARYTLEFEQEAVRLVRGGQTVSPVAKMLGLITGKVVSAEQMEIARLKAELAKTRMERDILRRVRS